MPNDELINWIEYLKMQEAKERTRMIQALTFVALQLFPAKEEEK
jgi:hypothetical protein